MKSKILDKHIQQSNSFEAYYQKDVEIAMDEYAQSLANEVVEELDKSKPNGDSNGAISYRNGINHAMILLKQKFNIK